MIPSTDTSGGLATYRAVAQEAFWRDGHITTVYAVYIPDRSVSGDYRLEYVEVVGLAQPYNAKTNGKVRTWWSPTRPE